MPEHELNAGPPADPEEWTDEQWIDWLKATDADGEPEGDAPVTRMGRVTRSGPGQVLGSAMMGMAQAIWGQQEDEIVHVVERGSEPLGDEPFELHLDPESPERSTVVFPSDPESDPESDAEG
jgi:hypothetical protein